MIGLRYLLVDVIDKSTQAPEEPENKSAASKANWFSGFD